MRAVAIATPGTTFEYLEERVCAIIPAAPPQMAMMRSKMLGWHRLRNSLGSGHLGRIKKKRQAMTNEMRNWKRNPIIASRVNVLPGVMSAVAAGAFEDALSSLPPMSSICFFTIAALVSRKAYFPRPFLLAVFPAYAVWTSMCKAGPIGDALVSLMLSLPLGAVAFVIVLLVLTWAGGKAGFDE